MKQILNYYANTNYVLKRVINQKWWQWNLFNQKKKNKQEIYRNILKYKNEGKWGKMFNLCVREKHLCIFPCSLQWDKIYIWCIYDIYIIKMHYWIQYYSIEVMMNSSAYYYSTKKRTKLLLRQLHNQKHKWNI